MKSWKTIFTANNQVLGEVIMKRGILQLDTLSPPIFAIVLIPFSVIRWGMECG